MWACYAVTYRPAAPVHIGWHQLGLIRRTRRFIPARNVWGAWTAGWARRGRGFEAGFNPYVQAEKELECVRFTPLFAAEKDDVLRPRFGKDGLRYGDLTPGTFDAKFVHGAASVAIEPTTFTAEEGMLHEREYLAGEGLSFRGYVLFESGGLSGKGGWDALWARCERIGVGGNQGYGCGWMKGDIRRVGSGELLFEEFAFDEATGQLRGEALAAVADFTDCSVEADGELELLGSRGYDLNRGAGQKTGSQFGSYWTPGSLLRAPRSFRPGAQGGWTPAS